MTFARLRVWVVAFVACTVLGAGGCASLDVKQREVIFRPEKDSGATPGDYGLAFQDVWLDVPRVEGEGTQRVHGWWIPAADPNAPSVLYLHGTRWSISGNLFRIARWQRMGFNVLAIDYRGFGRSDGELPSEAQAYADALAAWAELRRREPAPSRRFVYGHSLGGAVAIDLATRSPDMAGLVVESSFTSILDMAETTKYGFLPVGLILTQRFDSLSKVPKLAVPVLYVHGAADRWVPPSMSERLHAASPAPKRLVVVEGGGHSNVSGVAFDLYQREVRAFVAAAGGVNFAGAAVSAAAD
jgi:alpha-beta hydrolase superfamily lysophospholipase